jgi:hypothetical protein
MVVVVGAILVLGVVSFAGTRWWLSRDGETDLVAAPTAASTERSTATESRPGKQVPPVAAASPVPATTAPPVVITATVTTTAAPPGPVTPVPTASPAATPRPESIGGVLRQDVGCDGSYVVVLASALDRAGFERAATGIGASYPGAKYLISGSSCLNFRSTSAYVLYEGTYPTVGDACAARFAGTRDAYVKIADPAVTDRVVSCLCPSRYQLPDLGSGSDGAYVTEAQYALQRLGYYAGDGTGVFDPDTEQAVLALQAGSSLPADGRLTATTWSVLIAADCAG